MFFHKASISVLALLILSGCSGYGVTFQSAPIAQLSNCYSGLVGDWRIIEGNRSEQSADKNDFISISANCSTMYSVTLRQKSDKKANDVDDLRESGKQQIQFATVDDMAYVVVTPKETSFDVTPDIKTPSGKIIYLINPGKDGLILRSVDIDKTIQLILARKISGQIFVDRDNPDAKHAANVYVRGDAKQIAGYLATLDMYSDERFLLISATPAERKLLSKAIKHYERDNKNRLK